VSQLIVETGDVDSQQAIYVDPILTHPPFFMPELSQRKNHGNSLTLNSTHLSSSHHIEEERVSYLVHWSIMKLTDKLNNAIDGSFVGRFFQIKVRYHQ
jgi:hypothetical protein